MGHVPQPRQVQEEEMIFTEELAEKWHADRRKGIGGSDMGDLFGEGGCPRRLHYDKAGFPPDTPEDTIGRAARGQALEAAAADLYSSITGRELSIPTTFVYAPEPWNRVNADRIIAPVPEHEGVGILEIKTANQWEFRRMRREGMKSRHVLQLQHALGVTDRKWGAFMVLDPESWNRFHFDVDRDDGLIKIIREKTAEFWGNVVNELEMPERLEPSDSRCKGCKFKSQCQGAANVFMFGLDKEERARELPEAGEMADWLEAWDENRSVLKAAEESAEELKGKVKDLLGDRDAVQCGDRRIYYTASERTTIDTKKLKGSYPDVAAECSRTTTVRALRVY